MAPSGRLHNRQQRRHFIFDWLAHEAVGHWERVRARRRRAASESVCKFACAPATWKDHFEQPDLAAENKGPDYFAHRPPPNIVIVVRRVDSGKDVPFRVNSSGGGKNLEVYYVDADIDMLEEKAVRRQRAEEFVEWMLTQPGGERQSQLLRAPKQRLVDQFEEQYIHNPSGEYEISARYTPSTQGNWAGTLESGPARIRVLEAVDFFAAMKAKLAAR